MSESRDHICPRCGSYLPTVTVRVPIYRQTGFSDGRTSEETVDYEEREEVAECVRCTGAY